MYDQHYTTVYQLSMYINLSYIEITSFLLCDAQLSLMLCGQTAFSVFLCGGGKRVWFIAASGLDASHYVRGINKGNIIMVLVYDHKRNVQINILELYSYHFSSQRLWSIVIDSVTYNTSMYQQLQSYFHYTAQIYTSVQVITWLRYWHRFLYYKGIDDTSLLNTFRDAG